MTAMVLCGSCGARVPLAGDDLHVITMLPVGGDPRVNRIEMSCSSETAALASLPRRGVLMIDGWGGRSYQPVVVEAETPKRYRVRAVGDRLRLPSHGGRGVRIVFRSGTVLVPKTAVRLDRAEARP